MKILHKTGTTVLYVASLALAAPGLQAQSDLPLTGPAWALADEGYKAFARGDYGIAREKAREALRLRPDAVQLQELIRKIDAAQRPAAFQSKPTAPRARVFRSPPAIADMQPAPSPPRPDPAFAAAAEGYKAYDSAKYAAAVGFAQEAVRLAPMNRDYRLLLVNALLADGRLPEADQAITAAIAEAGDDGRLVAQQQPLRRRMQDAQALALGTAAYADFERADFAAAASNARQALQLTPGNRDYQTLLVRSLYRNNQYAEAEQQADIVIGRAPDASLFMLRGQIRQKLGQEAGARDDFESALRLKQLTAAEEVALLLDLGRKSEARTRFEQARADGSLALSGAELGYLAVRVGNDEQALKAFNQADTAGKLRSSAWGDAAYAAVRAGEDAQAIGYFKRTIDDAGPLKLAMTPQMLFETRRAVAEVSREFGAIASVSYRGSVSGSGLPPGAPTDSVQGGAELYWRPWGYRNARYTEIFVRGFQTFGSKGGGATGSQTLQTAAGIRHKPFTDVNLVGSISRVFAPSGGKDDWLAQIGYSGGTGGDLRVDVPSWWTSRTSAEVGRYLSAGQTYALAQADLGRSFRVGESGRWVVFPHLSLAADYSSVAQSRSSAGIGPGIGARYWFREDVYNAPRSYLDVSLQYRGRVTGAPRAGGVFLLTTLSY
ncbi:MAG: tetratricopeptide repeat protein [Polaromonas sp.]|uniref:NfrA family protein n=1 Tax=Polaromonas sp. TaxID=1869339 RepID=UPI001837B26F|nr:tetratricopeptide repeat protein [Polaromonas sp.]MBA3592484.1 tetratricopeptide repeat protein [Polaromonas sp.]